MKYEFSSRLALPNPFENTVVIEFELPADATVTLKIIDERGRLVMTPVENLRFTSGQHSLSIDRASLKRDACYYRLIAEMGNKVEVDVKKMEVE